MSAAAVFSSRFVANVFAVAAADHCSQRAELTGAAHICLPLNSASGVPRSAQCSGFARTASAHSLRQRDHFSRTRRATRVRTRMLLSLRCSHHSATPAVHSPRFALALLSLPGSSRDGKPPLERADHCAFALLPSVSIGALPACGLLRTAALAALLASLRRFCSALTSLRSRSPLLVRLIARRKVTTRALFLRCLLLFCPRIFHIRSPCRTSRRARCQQVCASLTPYAR